MRVGQAAQRPLQALLGLAAGGLRELRDEIAELRAAGAGAAPGWFEVTPARAAIPLALGPCVTMRGHRLSQEAGACHPAGDLSQIAQLPWVDDALPPPLAWERHAGCDDGIRELLGGDVHDAPPCVQDVRVALVIRLAGGVQGHELEEEVLSAL